MKIYLAACEQSWYEWNVALWKTHPNDPKGSAVPYLLLNRADLEEIFEDLPEELPPHGSDNVLELDISVAIEASYF